MSRYLEFLEFFSAARVGCGGSLLKRMHLQHQLLQILHRQSEERRRKNEKERGKRRRRKTHEKEREQVVKKYFLWIFLFFFLSFSLAFFPSIRLLSLLILLSSLLLSLALPLLSLLSPCPFPHFASLLLSLSFLLSFSSRLPWSLFPYSPVPRLLLPLPLFPSSSSLGSRFSRRYLLILLTESLRVVEAILKVRRRRSNLRAKFRILRLEPRHLLFPARQKKTVREDDVIRAWVTVGAWRDPQRSSSYCLPQEQLSKSKL